MNQASRDSAWYQATTLLERAAVLRASPQDNDSRVDTERAMRRAALWRSQPHFAGESAFVQRLAGDGLSENELFHHLGEPIEEVQKRFADCPAWIEKLTEALNSATAVTAQVPANGGLLDAFEPLIRRSRDRVCEGVQALLREQPGLPLDPDATEPLLFAGLAESLLMMCARTLVLEMHVARLEGLLPGDTPEERFQIFLRRLRQRGAIHGLLQEYPVLARAMVVRLDLWGRCEPRICSAPVLRLASDPGDVPPWSAGERGW